MQLKGTDPVEAIDLSGKHLGVASAVVIGALVAVNASLTSVLAFPLFIFS